ncbi:MAG: LytR family transcriptional regulator [Actinobacteria bacterium]|nr:MAG: LytR family transcriptional regulator [Actinomycetota bacterium]
MTPDEPRERSVWWKFAAGGLLMVLLTAAATATAGLLAIKDVADRIPKLAQDVPVEPTKPGKPQTLLLLGSDRRYVDRNSKNAARSDTIMLIRLDPGQEATTLLSIPRDLKTEIPGYGYDKINSAYSLGGPKLTLRTVKELLGIKVNHIINVNFSGFRKAVDLLGCVYTDVDRRYYHSNAGLPASVQYAEINIRPGYQKLCGKKALDYVRFRHADSDLVRAARQQDFLRQAKDQISSSSLINHRGKLIDIFTKSTEADKQLATVSGLERLVKLAIFSAGHPVRQVTFPAQFVKDTLPDGTPEDYVTADPAAVSATVQQFLHGAKRAAHKQHSKRSHRSRTRVPTLLVNVARANKDLVAPSAAKHSLGFPIYYPTRATSAARPSNVDSPRLYTIRDRADKPHRAYRLVYIQSEIEGQYYGIEGTDWRTPPLLSHPTGHRTIDGRRLLLFREGERLRTVAWRTSRAVYWVSNTLGNSLTNDQMIGIAATATRVKKHR